MMFGGWYILARRDRRQALIVGPVGSYDEALPHLETAAKITREKYKTFSTDMFTVGYVLMPELINGEFNSSFWLNYVKEPVDD